MKASPHLYASEAWTGRAAGRAPHTGTLSLLLLAVSVLVAALLGLSAAILPPIAIAFLVALVLGAALVTQPVLLLWLTMLSTLFIAGAVKYFVTGFDRIWWVGYGLAASMYLAALLHLLAVRRPRAFHHTAPARALAVLLLLFVALILGAAVANAVPIGQFAAASKSWLLYGGVIALLAAVPLKPDTVRRWGLAILVLACMQVLPVVYQFLFVRGRRLDLGIGATATEASDSVVGTFGGSMEGGGMSAVLAFFLCVVIAFVLLARKHQVVGRARAAVLVGLLGVPLLLMEVKIAFVYLPLMLLLVYRAAILRNPLGFIAGAMLTIAVGAAGLLAYQNFHWDKTGRDVGGNVERFFGYSFEQQASIERYRAGVMTRREAVEFWWDRHDSSSLAPALFGHGFGAARTEGLALGSAAAPNWPRKIDMTGASSLLWELGIVGTGLFLASLVAGFVACSRMSKLSTLLPWQRALAGSLQVLFVLTVVSLPYRNDIPYAAPMMFLLMSGFGLTFWLGRQAAERVSTPPGRT